MEFDQIIAPLGRDEFLTAVWEKKWLHVPGTPGRFGGLVSWDDLNVLLDSTRMAPPHIKLSQDGRTIEPERYVYTPPGAGSVPRIDSGRLAALLAEGATLVLNMVEEVSPPVRALSESIREALQARNYVNLYAGWHSQNGFDLHWDAHEVLVLQVHGRKRWQIFAPTQDYPLDYGVPPKPKGAPVWDGMLEDGDMLYLPRGWWHVAHPVNAPSLHLTFGIAPAHGLSLLGWMVGKLRGQAFARQNLPLLQDAASRKAHLARLRAMVTEALDDDAIENFLRDSGEHVRGRPRLHLPQAPYDQIAPLQDATRIILASTQALAFTVQGDKASFNAYGKTYSVPLVVTPALALLRDVRDISVAELCASLDSDAAAASLKKGLEMLARAGVVLVIQP